MYLRIIGQRTAKTGVFKLPHTLSTEKKLTLDQVHQTLIEQGLYSRVPIGTQFLIILVRNYDLGSPK